MDGISPFTNNCFDFFHFFHQTPWNVPRNSNVDYKVDSAILILLNE